MTDPPEFTAEERDEIERATHRQDSTPTPEDPMPDDTPTPSDYAQLEKQWGVDKRSAAAVFGDFLTDAAAAKRAARAPLDELIHRANTEPTPNS